MQKGVNENHVHKKPVFSRWCGAGDIIAFGSWYNLELDECIEYLKIVKEQNKKMPDFSKFIGSVAKF